jgi:putative drug exporter of the RND superfamily
MKSISITERLARVCARRRGVVFGIWAALFILGGALSSDIGDVLTTDMRLSNNPESQRANDLIAQRFPQIASAREIVVVSSERLTVEHPSYESFIGRLLLDIRQLDGIVESTTSYYESGDEGLVSRDRHRTLVPIVVAGERSEAAKLAKPLLDLLSSAGQEDGFEVLTAGGASIGRVFNETSEKDLKNGELRALPFAIIVLLVVFGAAVAAGVPILVAVLSIVVATGTAALVGRAFELSFFVVNMITMIGLAVGIDYSLFIVARFRQERADGLSTAEAIGRTGATASRAVLFSGGTVIIALVGLFIVPSTVYRSLAVGAIAVAAVSVLAALTLLPAVLSALGDRVNAVRPPLLARRFSNSGNGPWARVTSMVMNHPVLSTVAAVALLVAAGVPAAGLEMGQSGVSTLPQGSGPRAAFEILDREFSGGLIAPAEVVIEADLNALNVQTAIDDLVSLLEQDPGFGAGERQTDDSGRVIVLSFPVAGDPDSDAAHAAIRRLRAEYIPRAFTSVEATVLVTGATAQNEDFFATISRYTPIVFSFVLGLSFLLLLILFRSIIVPVKALVMNLLSVGAAYGLLVLVFQHGIGAEILGFQRTETIEAWLPLFLFTVLFGLSMDYHVFLLSRIKEHFDQTGNNREAVAFGMRTTSGIITGAALIMVAVFAGFATGELSSMQQMGFGLAVAVILDATVIRSILVPASMQLLGDRNWYLPHFLSWLPHLEVEGPSGARAALSGGD